MTRPLAFWDTSAVAGLILMAHGSAAHRRYFRETRVVVWWGTRVEAFGAVHRFFAAAPGREHRRAAAMARLQALAGGWSEVVPSEAVRQLAVQAIERHGLKAADAVQLAAALIWCGERPQSRLFLAADRKLAAAAAAAGFQTPAV